MYDVYNVRPETMVRTLYRRPWRIISAATYSFADTILSTFKVHGYRFLTLPPTWNAIPYCMLFVLMSIKYFPNRRYMICKNDGNRTSLQSPLVSVDEPVSSPSTSECDNSWCQRQIK